MSVRCCAARRRHDPRFVAGLRQRSPHDLVDEERVGEKGPSAGSSAKISSKKPSNTTQYWATPDGRATSKSPAQQHHAT